MARRIGAAQLLKKARGLGVPETVLEQCHTNTWTRDGVIHYPEGWCDTLTTVRRSRSWQRVEVPSTPMSLTDIAAGSACGQCEDYLVYNPPKPGPLDRVIQLVEAADLVATAGRIVNRHDKKGSAPGRIKKLIDELTSARHRVERLRQGELGELDPVAETVSDSIVKALREISALSAGKAQQEKIEQRLVEELVPRNYRGKVGLDKSLVLAGFIGYVNSRKVEEVFDAYTIRNEAGIRVLLCPRFVYDYLGRSFQAGGNWSGSLLTSTSFTGDDTLAETAAALWDPSSVTLGDLAAAVAAAEAVSA